MLSQQFIVLVSAFLSVLSDECRWSTCFLSTLVPLATLQQAAISQNPEDALRFLLILVLALFVATFVQSMVGVRQVVKRGDVEGVISDLFSLLFTGAASGHAILALNDLGQQNQSAVLFLILLDGALLALVGHFFLRGTWLVAAGVLGVLSFLQYSKEEMSRVQEVAPALVLSCLTAAPLSKIYNDNFG